MVSKPTVRRSACDPCRARRVQCLRAQDSTAPCARCSHIGARCVKSAPGQPGRPRKPRQAESVTPPRGPAPRPVCVEVRNLVMAGAPASAGELARACDRTDNRTTWDRLDDMAETDVAASKSTAHPPRDPLADVPSAADFWATPGDNSVYFDSPSVEQSAAPGEDMLALGHQLGSPSQPQELLSADDELCATLHMSQDSECTALDIVVDPLLDQWMGALPSTTSTPFTQCPSPASLLMRYREKLDQQITALDAYYSEPLQVVQGCKDEGAGQEPENPAAVLLTCTKEFTDIVQSLTTPAGRTHNESESESEDVLSTEIVLLALSSYLALMRLFDVMFHTIHKLISELPPDSFKSAKVKSVLRIGGIVSLQDMSLKTYAAGIVDAIQGQVRILERSMGIPAEYCLSGEAAAGDEATAPPGILSRADRAWLFAAVLAQEDVKSRRGSKSYVESIRSNIRKSMRFLDD